MTQAEIQSELQAAAARYGVPASIALSVAAQESGYNQDARGAAGEVGIMQLMPATAAGLGVDPYDPAQNIDGGVRLLADGYSRFGSWSYSLASYNAGPTRASQGPVGWPKSTQSYVPQVLARAGTVPGSLVDSYQPTAMEEAPVVDWATVAPILAAGAVAVLVLS